jgi:hypothetical protein
MFLVYYSKITKSKDVLITANSNISYVSGFTLCLRVKIDFWFDLTILYSEKFSLRINAYNEATGSIRVDHAIYGFEWPDQKINTFR